MHKEETVQKVIEKVENDQLDSEELNGAEHTIRMNHEKNKQEKKSNEALLKTIKFLKDNKDKTIKFVKRNKKPLIKGATTAGGVSLLLGLTISPHIINHNQQKQINQLLREKEDMKEAIRRDRVEIESLNKDIEKIKDNLRATMNSVRDNAVEISRLESDLTEKIKEEGWNTYLKALANDKEISYSIRNQLFKLRQRIKEAIKTFENKWGNKLLEVGEFLVKLGEFEQELKQKLTPRVEKLEQDVKVFEVSGGEEGETQTYVDKLSKAVERINSLQKQLRQFNKKIEKLKQKKSK